MHLVPLNAEVDSKQQQKFCFKPLVRVMLIGIILSTSKSNSFLVLILTTIMFLWLLKCYDVSTNAKSILKLNQIYLCTIVE